MISKAKTALVAAFVLGTASAALAQSGEEFQNSQYQLNPNAQVPVYTQSAAPRAELIEGRNVSVRQPAQERQADRLESFGGY